MSLASSSLALKLNPNAQLLFADPKQTYAWTGVSGTVIKGISRAILEAIAEQARDPITPDALIRQLMLRYPPAYLGQVMAVLRNAQVLITTSPVNADLVNSVGVKNEITFRSPTYLIDKTSIKSLDRIETKILERPIITLGNQKLLPVLVQTLSDAGFQAVQSVVIESFESCSKTDFLVRQEQVFTAILSRPSQAISTQRLKSATLADLSECFRHTDLVLCALEGMPFQALFEVNQAALAANVPCLFINSSAVSTTLGPTVVRGLTACFACWAEAVTQLPMSLRPLLPHLCTPVWLGEDLGLLQTILRYCVEEVVAVLQYPPQPQLVAQTLQISRSIHREVSRHPLFPQGDCPACAPYVESEAVQTLLAHTAAATAATDLMQQWTLSPNASTSLAPDAYRSVGILGGGTAGYLTALSLKKIRPELDVTLIESSQIPIIGVGEATTPELVRWLHHPRFLNLDIGEFFRQVQPTWKLGIKFEWGLSGDYSFTFPFQRGRLLESHCYASTLNEQSLGAMLMQGNRAPVTENQEGNRQSWLPLVRWAYHLDNQKFVSYLKTAALAAGVRYLDAQVYDTCLAQDGETVLKLLTKEGQSLSYDLYIDCSGFRSVLLEQALGSRFISYSNTLFTDRAVTATVPHNGTIKPYTLAETMNCGWCWNIPFAESDHRGYVFSSAFISEDEAINEMQSKNPGMGEPQLVKFRSGRHEHFWKGNVIAIGNSYGFVEPLESTALHMIVLELDMLTTHFPSSRHDQAIKSILNRKVGDRWDALRWFLGIHYRFNRRLETPFWQSANQDVDITGAQARVARFQEQAPLSYKPSLFYTVLPPEFFSDDHAYDTLLLGQQVSARYVQPTERRVDWQRQSTILKAMASSALPQQEVLPWISKERPDLLYNFVQQPESWIHSWLPS